MLAEKAVPSCVALGHGVNVCPPNLETGGEQKSGTLDTRPLYTRARTRTHKRVYDTRICVRIKIAYDCVAC